MISSIATRSALYRNPVSVCITLDCGYPSICVMIEYAGIDISVATMVLYSLLLTCMYLYTHDCIVLNVLPRCESAL